MRELAYMGGADRGNREIDGSLGIDRRGGIGAVDLFTTLMLQAWFLGPWNTT